MFVCSYEELFSHLKRVLQSIKERDTAGIEAGLEAVRPVLEQHRDELGAKVEIKV